MDLSEFSIIKDKILSGIKSELESDKTSQIFETCVRRYMNPGKNPGGKSTSDKLYINRGQLVNSLKRGDPNNLWEVTIEGGSINLNIGSKLPQAPVHEYGYRNIPKRPYLNPALELFNLKYLQAIVDDAIKNI